MSLILFCLYLLLISTHHHKFLVHSLLFSSAANINSVYHSTSLTIYLSIQTHTLYHLNISYFLLSLQNLVVSLTNWKYILLYQHYLFFSNCCDHYHVILLIVLFILVFSLFYDILCSGLVVLIKIFFFFL